MSGYNICRKCSAASNDGLVLLWDGHMYCPSCLNAADPLLADYAMNHPVLSEELPERIKRKLPAFWTVFFQLVSLRSQILMVIVLVLIFALSSSLITGIMWASLIFAISFTGKYLLVYLFNGFSMRPRAEKVSVSVTDGIVEVRRDDQIITFPLTSSFWTDCSTGEACPFASVLQSEALLLVFNKRSQFLTRKSAHAMCGFDHESRERWLAFLQLAGIPIHRPGK